MSFKKILMSLVLLFLSMAVTLMFAEGFIRIYDSKSRQFSGPQPGGQLHNPTEKILILGDSFLAPWTWAEGEGLYELIDRKTRPFGVQFLNTAMPGFGPADYWIQLKTFGGSYKPDAVLLFYSVTSDLTDIQYHSGRSLNFKLWIKPFLAKSALFNFLNQSRNVISDKLAKRKYQKRKLSEGQVSPSAKRVINPYYFELGSHKPNYVLDNLLLESKESQQAWRTGEGFLGKIAAFCRQRKIKLYLIALPSMAQIDEKYLSLYKATGFRLDSRILSEQKPQELLQQFTADQHIALLDLLPAMREHKEAAFFDPTDIHFNPAGRELAAEAVLQFLKEEGALKS